MLSEFWKGLDTNKDQLTLLIAFISLILVFNGLRSWRLQLIGTNRIKLAKTLLCQIYLISDLIHDARICIFNEYEEPSDKNLDEKEKLSIKLGNRLKPINEAFKELEKTYYESKVEWEFTSDKYFKELRKIYMEYTSAINMYLQYYDIQGIERSEAFHIVFSNGNDAYKRRLDELVKNFDNWLRPKFQGWLKWKILMFNK